MDLMVVKTVRPSARGEEVMVVLQTTSGDRYLGFLAPLNEANRLARVLGMSGCRCAPIYELLLGLASAADTPLERAVLDAALSVRSRAPLYATPAALALAFSRWRGRAPGGGGGCLRRRAPRLPDVVRGPAALSPWPSTGWGAPRRPARPIGRR
jgi:hypothetical protein